MRVIRFLTIGLLAATGAGCDRGNDSAAQVDPTQLTSSGEVALADGGSMSFSISSEQYKQWDQARRAFPKSLITRFGQVLQPRAPSERSINAAVALLEGHPQARAAIEQAGLSVRGFVEITVALEQQMMLASGRGREPAPMPDSYPMTMDSTYMLPPMPTQPYPLPQPVPAEPYPYPAQPYPVQPPVTPYPAPTPVLPSPRDTVRRDTIAPAPIPSPTPVPPPRPDTQPVRRDTAPPPARRDTAAGPSPRRDTIRDTMPVGGASPDSVSRG